MSTPPLAPSTPGTGATGAHLSAEEVPDRLVESVYVHAPFCARRCFYCDFAVHVRRTGDLETWADAIAREFDARLASGVRLADHLRTLYVGGGTPSLLGAEAMRRLRLLLGDARLDGPSLEWTAEANPESLTDEVAEGWRAAGVSRLSLGVQSFQDAPLRWMGRLHGAAGAVEAVATARAAGFEAISVDLIFALPERVERSWSDDLARVLDLGVPHVSLYGLTAEPGTGLGRGVDAGRVSMADDERYRSEFVEAHERLTTAGYRHYEVSNFALPGFESRHNEAYWDRSPYLGLGNGAHSFVAPLRWWNRHAWPDYLTSIEAGGDPTDAVERLDRVNDRLEAIWTGLRTAKGLSIAAWGEAAARLARRWETAGLGSLRDGQLRLTVDGWLLLDSLALEFDAVAG